MEWYLLHNQRATILDGERQQELHHLRGDQVLLRHKLRRLVLQQARVAMNLGENLVELLRFDLRGGNTSELFNGGHSLMSKKSELHAERHVCATGV